MFTQSNEGSNSLASAQTNVCPFVFNGRTDEDVEKFIRDFEEYVHIKKWGEVEAMIYLKLSLKEKAKVWLVSMGSCSYEELRKSLVRRFSGSNKILSSITRINKMKYNPGEPVCYFLDRMRAEASSGNITFEVVFAFFIKEIPHSLSTMLLSDVNISNWELVYDVVNRWECSQISTNREEKDCFKIQKYQKQNTWSHKECWFCGKKGHLQ
ncbi:Zinc knuckle, partial [Conglomerata obtusa]